LKSLFAVFASEAKQLRFCFKEINDFEIAASRKTLLAMTFREQPAEGQL
jgi:hypothetical protein